MQLEKPITTEQGRDYINEQYQRFDASDQAALVHFVEEVSLSYE